MKILPSSSECLLILLTDIAFGYTLPPSVERGNKIIIAYYLGIVVFNILREVGAAYGPCIRTGEGYVREGGRKLLEGIGLLVSMTMEGEGGRYVVPAEERVGYHERAEILLEEQDNLHTTTEHTRFCSISGHARNWRAARAFYKRAEGFNREVKDLVSKHTKRIQQLEAQEDKADKTDDTRSVG